jgi:hypothetical protein
MFISLHEFVKNVNSIYKCLISWPQGLTMIIIMKEFKQRCGLPSMQGVIDGIHISIVNSQSSFTENYYYHKIGGYNIVVQAIIH